MGYLDSTLREIARLEDIVLQQQAGVNRFAREIASLVGMAVTDETPVEAIVSAVKARIDALEQTGEEKAEA